MLIDSLRNNVDFLSIRHSGSHKTLSSQIGLLKSSTADEDTHSIFSHGEANDINFDMGSTTDFFNQFFTTLEIGRDALENPEKIFNFTTFVFNSVKKFQKRSCIMAFENLMDTEKRERIAFDLFLVSKYLYYFK